MRAINSPPNPLPTIPMFEQDSVANRRLLLKVLGGKFPTCVLFLFLNDFYQWMHVQNNRSLQWNDVVSLEVFSGVLKNPTKGFSCPPYLEAVLHLLLMLQADIASAPFLPRILFGFQLIFPVYPHSLWFLNLIPGCLFEPLTVFSIKKSVELPPVCAF